MQCCVKTFQTVGTGSSITQTITGIVDKDGTAFIGKTFMFVGGNAALNTVTSGASGSSWHYDASLADLTHGGCFGTGDVYQFSAKICSGAVGSAGIMDTQPDIFFGGAIAGTGFISAIRSGEFDITWNSHNRAGDYRMVVVWGGSDLDMALQPTFSNGTFSTPSQGQGLLIPPTNTWTTPGGASTGAGGGPITWGFDSRDSGKGASYAFAGNQGGNARNQITTSCTLGGGTVSAWNPSNYTVSGNSTVGSMMVAFCGTGIKTTGGSFIQQASTGHQTVVTNINAKWLMLMSVGAIPLSGEASDRCEMSIGCTDQVRQTSYWAGETTVGNGPPLAGARYISDNSIMRFAAAAGASTTFLAVAELVEVDETGSFTINWTTNDGVGREILWFAVGEQAAALGTIEVDKVWGEGAAGQVTLRIGTTPGAEDIDFLETGVDGGAPLVLGPITVDSGDYYISETHSNLYDVSITATVNGVDTPIEPDGLISLETGDVVVVTFTNNAFPPPSRPKQWKLYSFNMKLRKEERA